MTKLPSSIFAKKTRPFIEGGDFMNENFGFNFNTDAEYVYVTLSVGENKFDCRILRENVKNIVLKMLQSKYED